MKRKIKKIYPIPTPSMVFNYESGIGGLPLGYIVCIYGPTGSWKSSFIIEVAALIQTLGKKVKWYDEEQSYTDAWAVNYGVDIAKLEIDYHQYAHELFDDLYDDMASEDNEDLAMIVIDSIMDVDYARFDKEGKKKGILDKKKERGAIARFLVEGLPELGGAMKARRKRGSMVPLVVFLNHFRTNPTVSFGNPNYMPGGSQIYHDSKMIIEVIPMGAIRKQVGGKKVIVGRRIKGKFDKNRCDIESQNNTFEYEVATKKSKYRGIGINKGQDRRIAGELTGAIEPSMKKNIAYELNGTKFKTINGFERYLADMDFREVYKLILDKPCRIGDGK